MNEFITIPFDGTALVMVAIWGGVAFFTILAIINTLQSRKRRYQEVAEHPDDPPPRER